MCTLRRVSCNVHNVCTLSFVPPLSCTLPSGIYMRVYLSKVGTFKKMLHKYGKSRILIASQHFSMVLLWGQLHKDFLRFDNWTRPSGRHGDFYQVAQGQHPLLCALSTTESLSCPKSIGSIGGLTIFQGQQYSSCSKAGGYRAAQLRIP